MSIKSLPSENQRINWDEVAHQYHDVILSPFAIDMLAVDKSGHRRNLLVTDLLEIPEETLTRLSILDAGCGPGNLLDVLGHRLRRISAVDLSAQALHIATQKAQHQGIDFEAIQQDLSRLSVKQRFDLIISVNAILPEQRETVVNIFKSLKQHLNPGGVIMAILPSFDTTLYLRSLWREKYSQSGKASTEVDELIEQWCVSKKLDESTHAYADDGEHSQCYHAPETIRDELAEVGLELKQPLKKIYYPWSLCRRFGYGYFPDADEEIWDWYLVAGCD